MKLKRLDETKRLFPHWLDRNKDSNFSKHLTVINNQQLDLYHKIKTVDWGRMLEKPIQIWKTQTEKYDYAMNFKVNIPYLKEVNIYKNPKIDKKGLIASYEERVCHKEYANDDINFFTYVHEDTSDLIIPRDTYIIEIYTWDDYHWLKGFPENDYIAYNELDYRFNESYLKIEYEEISYSKFLTFRVHIDKIKLVEIFKNEELIYQEDFLLETFDNTRLHSKDFSYKYFDYDNNGNIETIYEIENSGLNSHTIYRSNIEKDEYVFRLPLFDEDFDENGMVKDNYDLFVTVYDKKGKCSSEDILDYSKLKKDYPNVDSYYIVNVLPNASDLTLGKILIIKEDDEYNAYETVQNGDNYEYKLIVSDIDYTVKRSRKGSKVYKKRYVGYDNILGDCFDHDYSLDKIGHLYNIHRYKFYKVPKRNEYYFDRTYPKYNNRLTEDDYHYMKRIQRYISEYNQTYFPVLEYWKYYYSPSVLVNRKIHLGEQDHTYFRTNYYNCDDVAEVLIDEEFDDEDYITEYDDSQTNLISTSIDLDSNKINYHLSKATVRTGISNHIEMYDYEYNEIRKTLLANFSQIDDISGLVESLISAENEIETITGFIIELSDDVNLLDDVAQTVYNIKKKCNWEEAILVNNVYVVPNNNYRLRFGVNDNLEDVTIRMICYNRQGQQLRSMTIIPSDDGLDDTYYPVTDNYDYTDTLINIQDDVASVVVLLESDDNFSFTDVTFQRQTVTGYDNKYMKTSTNWNSCVYDLYADYNDIPVNLHLDDTTTFNLLFRRSLPLTKIGFFNINFSEGANNQINLETSASFEIINYFGALRETVELDALHPFSRVIENFLEPNTEYKVTFYSRNTSERYEMINGELVNNNKNIEPTPSYLIQATFEMMDENYEVFDEYEFEERTDSQTETKSVFTFTTPSDIVNGRLIISSEEEAKLWDIELVKI